MLSYVNVTSIKYQNVSFIYRFKTVKHSSNYHNFHCYEIQCACQLKIACTDIGIDRTARKFQTISGKTRLAWPVLVRLKAWSYVALFFTLKHIYAYTHSTIQVGTRYAA